MNDIAQNMPTIVVTPGLLHELATEAEAALINAGVDFYTRGGQVVRPIIDEVDASKGRKTNSARLIEVNPDTMVDYLSRCARWERYDKRSKKCDPVDPPSIVAKIILARDGEWKFPPLAGVITTPTMRPDGTIFSTPGYDPQTRLVLFNPPPMPSIAANPSRDDALAALTVLGELLVEFPFVDEGSNAVALSALITPVVRGAMGVAPLHAFRAPVPGSGKSYLVDTASAIATGRFCPVIAAGRTEEETEKRLGGAMLLGYPVISIDNLNGELGGDCLCQLVERRIVSVRALGSSKLYQIESRATVFATGNNIQPTGDIIRRVILGSLDPNMERPEQREFKADPVALVLADRGKYIAAAMTVVRAWLNSGTPDPLPPLASFEEWSHTVRSALVWLGREDPVSTMETAREEDSDLQTLRAVVAAWAEAAGVNNPMTCGALKAFAEEVETATEGEYFHRHQKKLLRPDLHQALLDVASRGGEIDVVRLGKYLGRYQHRIVDGMKIMADEDTHKKQKAWWLRSVT
jgi:putative DNA primase/helicase